jgi:hypothetical protein
MSDMFKRMKNWKEDSGIPHKDGKIKWYVIGFEEDESTYLGEYDMTDWDKTFEEQVFPKAQEDADSFFASDLWQVMRADQLRDLMFNVASALQSSGDFKEKWIGNDWYDWLDEEDDEEKSDEPT